MRKFILGTDWWTDCDDVAALRLLARAHKANEIQLLGIILNGCMEYSVTSLEGFLNTEGIHDIPIGIDLEATDFGGNPPYQKRLSQYAKKYSTNNEAENALKLYRTLLASADEPVELIEIGYPQVLAALLLSKADDISDLSGMELIQKKVSKLWIMAGKWDQNPGTENNFSRNARARESAHILCKVCPVPITFLGWEIGATVISGTNLKKTDPLHLAFCDHGSPNGRSSWDPMLCLLATIGNEKEAGYQVVRGKASVDAITGENWFIQEENGLHSYVVKAFQDSYYEDEVNKRIRSHNHSGYNSNYPVM
ncbi:MAG: hypothetical protein E7487_11875 [Ruminococcaceae bacterium]|nr:hypothetical protein [Oscillospiraceae bacterium]